MMKLKGVKEFLQKIQAKSNSALNNYYDINYNISKFFIDFRVNNKMTQGQLAKKLNVSQAMVSKYENGEYNFTLKKLCEISEILEVSLNFEILYNIDDIKNDTIWNIGEKKLGGDLQCLSISKTA